MKKAMLEIATILVSLGLVVVGGSPPTTAHARDAELNGMIAFDQPVSSTGHTQIFTMNPDGSHVRELTFSRVADSVHPIWSPDGSTLVFSRFFADKAEVWAMNADGTEIHAITHGGFSGLPAYSPNGKLIAFERYISPTDDGLWIMNTDGTHMQRVTHNPLPSTDTACAVRHEASLVTGRRTTHVRPDQDPIQIGGVHRQRGRHGPAPVDGVGDERDHSRLVPGWWQDRVQHPVLRVPRRSLPHLHDPPRWWGARPVDNRPSRRILRPDLVSGRTDDRLRALPGGPTS